MLFTMNKTLHTIVVALFLLSTAAAEAYPLYVKVYNPRKHSLFIQSDSRHISIEIPPKESREVVICGPSDWHVRYSTGLVGNVKWTVDTKLDQYIDNECKPSMGDRWNEGTVKYCTLRFDDTAFSESGYTLTVTEIRELETKSNECNLSNNEKALTVFPSVIPLVAAHVLLAAKVLYIEKKKI